MTPEQRRLLTALSQDGARLWYASGYEQGFFGSVVTVGPEKPNKDERFHWATVDSCIKKHWIVYDRVETDERGRTRPLWKVTESGKQRMEEES